MLRIRVEGIGKGVGSVHSSICAGDSTSISLVCIFVLSKDHHRGLGLYAEKTLQIPD